MLYLIAFERTDASGMAQESAWLAGVPGMRESLLTLQCDRAVYAGQLRRARDLSRQLLALAGQKERAAAYETEAALREAVFGNPVEARQQAAAAVRLSTEAHVECAAA